MTMTGLLLTVHILGVAAWLGASLSMLTAGGGQVAAGAESAAGFYTAALGLARKYYNAAGVIVLATGVAMVSRGQAEWSSSFVSLGFLAVIIGALMGPVYFGPRFRAGIEAATAGDQGLIAAAWSKVKIGLFIDIALLVVTILAMVHRWGA